MAGRIDRLPLQRDRELQEQLGGTRRRRLYGRRYGDARAHAGNGVLASLGIVTMDQAGTAVPQRNRQAKSASNRRRLSESRYWRLTGAIDSA